MTKLAPKPRLHNSPANALRLSQPYYYFSTSFAANENEIPSFILTPTVEQLHQDFKAFEQLSRVHEWPVSKIIQREIDEERVSAICNEYLRTDKSLLKYFPPLTCVLLPLGDDHLPTDSYEAAAEAEQRAVNQRLVIGNERYSQIDSPEADTLSRGIYRVKVDDTSGDLIWDKRTVEAVIIDGQHRRAALIKAMEEHDKTFGQWHIPVHVVNIIERCSRTNEKPAEVIRDLFIHVNETPVHVPHARRILMNDRSVASKFTQELIDDSKGKQAIAPELVDWHCKGGKYETEYLTGVVPLYHIFAHAFFSGNALDDSGAKRKVRKVRAWARRLNEHLNIDQYIASKRQNRTKATVSELIERWETANNYDPEDGERKPELETPINWPPHIIDSITEAFVLAYKPSIELLWKELTPFKQVQVIAEESGAFEKKEESVLREYLRGTSKSQMASRSTKEVQGYLVAMSNRKESGTNLFHTVMGQKALFESFFRLLTKETNSDRTPEETLKFTKEFIGVLNHIYECLHGDNDRRHCLFNLHYAGEFNTKGIGPLGDLSSSFWKGILKKQNDEIDYTTTPVRIFSSILDSLIESAYEDSEDSFSFGSQASRITQRHLSILKRMYDDEDDTLRKRAQKLMLAKAKHLDELVKSIRWEE